MVEQPHDLALRLRPIFRKHQVERAILFGSMARGDSSKYSDVDLLLVKKTDKRFLDRYDALFPEICRAVSDRDVDLLIYTPTELSDLADRPFIAQALEEGFVLYESDEE